MRRQNRRVFGQSDLPRIGDRIQRSVLGLFQPIRLRVRLIPGHGEAGVIAAGLVVIENRRSQVHRRSVLHAGQPDSGERHLAGQALDRGEVHAQRRPRTYRRPVGLGLER